MEIIVEKTIDMLTTLDVNIITKKFVELDGVKSQVGENHRVSYSNSEFGRKGLIDNEEEAIINSVLAIWGDEPLIITENVEVVEEEIKEVE